MRVFFDIITILGFGLTALGTYLTCRSGEIADVIAKPIVSISLCFCVVFAVGWYHYYYKAMIMKSVLKGRDHLATAMTMINAMENNPTRKIHVEKGIQQLTNICQEVSAGYRRFHSVTISVCIHYINKDDNGPYVKVLCRNTESSQRMKSGPKRIASRDYVNMNSDFSEIIYLLDKRPFRQLYYFNNFLPWSIRYMNSHFTEYSEKRFEFRILNWVCRSIKWELPYKSSIVVPLITDDGQNVHQLQGFLSIDSPRMYSFSRRYDLPIVQHLAHAIAPIIEKYNQSNLLHTSNE